MAQAGATDPVRRLWQAINHLRWFSPSRFPMLESGLGMLCLAAILGAVVLYQVKSSGEADLARLEAIRASGGVKNDALAAGVAVSWSQVLQAVVASMPGDVSIRDVAFTADAHGAQAVVKGEATDYGQVISFADNLRSSPLFSKVAIQSMAQLPTPTPSATAIAATPTQVAPAAPTYPPPIFALPTSTPAFWGAPFPAISPTPTPWNPFAFPTAIAYPTLTPTPSGTPAMFLPATATPTAIAWATPTPSATATISRFYDFAVQSKVQTCDESVPADYSGDLISGMVVDVDGAALANVRLRVASIHTESSWSAEATTDNAGAYRFYLTKGNFKVEVASGTSETATELWTRSAQETGVCRWQVDFKKTSARTVTPVASWTPTPTLTATISPTITPTPPIGTVVAGTASASINSGDAKLAVDGDTGTMWSSGAMPYQYWQETFDTAYAVAGVNLVVAQAPNGNTSHTVRFYNSIGAEIINSALTLTGYTFDGQQLSQSLPAVLNDVRTVRIETTSGPSHVAWREVRVIVGPTPTATPTATATPRTWGRAQPINIGESQVRTLNGPGDVDWAVLHTAIGSSDWVTHTLQAIGGSLDTDLELHEGNGESGFVGYSDNACNGKDPLLVQPLKPNTTYYVKISDRGTSGGQYSLIIRTGALGCLTSANAANEAMPAPGATQPAGRSRLAAPLRELPLAPTTASIADIPKPVGFTIVVELKMRDGS